MKWYLVAALTILTSSQVYSTSVAMLLTMLLSVYLFTFKPTVQHFLGIVICMISLHMHFAPVHVLVDLPSASKAASSTLGKVTVEGEVKS